MPPIAKLAVPIMLLLGTLAGGLAARAQEEVLEPSPTVRALIDLDTVQTLEAAPVIRLGGGAADFAVGDPSNGDPLTCLAQAIYFEARSESVVGQQAVAQVVMNRTRIPRYPPSVCGVVFQGWERRTGCQFTFVCDGSLREPSDYDAWERARDIARKALAGFVYKPMQEATHYHAAWMTPYWSGQMTRIRQIGGHVFYR